MPEMPSDEQMAVYKSIHDTMASIEKMKGSIQTLQGTLQRFQDRMERDFLWGIANQFYYPLDLKAWSELSSKMNGELIGKLESLYLATESSPIMKESQMDNDPSNTSSPRYFSVDAEILDGMLIVRTPHLFNRNVSFFHSGKHSIGKDYHSFFAPEVDRKLGSMATRLPQFLSKNISVLSVYPESKQRLPDAENLDSKKIIDAILWRFPGTDSGKFCSIFQACVQNDTILEGTYFIVSEGFSVVPAFSKMMEMIASRWGK